MKIKGLKTVHYWILTALYCAGIFAQSSQPIYIPEALYFPGQDKLIHLIMFGGLAAVVHMALSGIGWRGWRRLLSAFVFAALYGASDEWHQYFVPGRSADVLDAVADAAGALLAAVILWRLRTGDGRAEGETEK